MLQRTSPKENNISWRTNKNNNQGVCLSGDKSAREQQIIENNNAQSYGSSHDLEARCGEPFISITSGCSIDELENNLLQAADKLNHSCTAGVCLMKSDDNATVNNVSSETRIITYRRRSHVKPLEYYCRKRSNSSHVTYSRQRRKGSGLSIMNSLSIQNGVENGTEDTFLAESVEAPSFLSSKNMCQNEVTAGDGASVIIMEDMTLEKAIDGCSECEHVAAKSVNNIKVNIENVSFDNVVGIQEENVEMAQRAQPNDIRNKVCDILVAEETLNKSTCSQENKAPYDVSGSVTWGTSSLEVAQTKQDTMRITSPSLSETNVLNDVITEFRNADTILSLTRGPNDSSRRKLIVLDVNGLLADIVPIAYVSDRYKPDTIISGKAVFKRPFCDEFLKFCFQRFSVGVWSSRIKRNVNSVVDFLMGKLRHNLLFCWDQSHCTGTGFNTVENSSKPLVLKELKKLWEKSEPDLPWERGEYNESNTLLLDDSPYKALCNPPNTAIFPHTYQYRDESDNSLGSGGDLYIYLEGLAEAADVQTYVKQNPFGQRPITEEDASWGFYLKVKESTVSIPSQSPKSSVKSENLVLEADMTSITAGKSVEFVDNECKNQEFIMVGSHDVHQTTNALRDVEADSASGSLKKEDLKSTSGTLKVDEFGEPPRENNRDCASSDSPSSIWRCRKRGRSGSRSRSPIRGRSWIGSRSPYERSPWGRRERHGQSPSLSHERCRSRSKSPSHRYGGEFGGDMRRRDKALPPACFAFIRGKCYRGASCRYLHQECDETGRSRSYRFQFQQQCQNVPPSSKSSDIYGETETIPPERSVHEHSEHKTQDLDQNILVEEERKGIKEGLGKFTIQQCDNMRRGKALLEECRNFMQGRCYRGASCRYLHQESDKIDRSRSYWSKEQYEDVPPSSKSSDIYGETETIPPERSIYEHSGCKTQDLDQDIPTMEERKGMKEEVGIFSTQPWGTMRRDKILCRHFMQGKCYRGESCWFLHSDKFDSSRSYWSKQQYQDVPPSSKSSDIYGETETVPPQRAVLEHTEQGTQDLDQDILVMEERNGMGKGLGKFTPQLCGRTRRDKVLLEECRDFTRGKCYRGASCRYLHQESDKVDRSRSCWSKHQYQDVPPSSKSSDTYGETETVPPESSVHEHNESKTQDLDQDIMFMDERRGMKYELAKFTSQLCDKRRSDEVCRKFLQGKCYRGASCRYLHQESDQIVRSISYWSRQHQDVPPSTKRSDIYGETESIPPERSVHEHSECETQHLDQNILVMEERKGMKEELSKFTTQLCDKTRRDEFCRKFMKGICYRGASCRYLHDESDRIGRSRSYWSKQQYQDDPRSSKSSDIYGKTETIPPGRSVHEHSGCETQDLVGKFTTQLCDKMRRDEACRKFMQGHCYRGASCQYLHDESYKIDGSRSYWSKQQYQDVPHSSKSQSIYWETKTIPPARSVHEHNECMTRHLEQDISVMGKEGMKEELGKSNPQLCYNMRTDKPLLRECRDYISGKCYRGVDCRYVHHEFDKTDRSIAYRSKQQCQNAPFSSKRSDIYGDIESSPHDRAVCEHNEFKTEDPKQNIPVLEERNCMKEELGKSTTQPCDGQSVLEPSVPRLVEDEKVSDDVANCVPSHVEVSVVEQTQNTANNDQLMTNR